MGCGVAEGAEGVKGADCFFCFRCGINALGFVNDEDWVGFCDEVNRPHTVEFVVWPMDDVGGVFFCGVFEAFTERIYVDDHDVHGIGGCECPYLFEFLAVVDEVVVDEVVVLCVEVVFCYFKRFCDSFFYGDVWYDNDEFGKSIGFVEFEDGFGVDVGFAGTGFHFYVEVVVSVEWICSLGESVFQLDLPEVLSDFVVADGKPVSDTDAI